MSATARRIRLFTAFAVVLHGAALAQPERLIPRPLSVNPLYAEGFVLYQMKCAGCHGEKGDGRGGSGSTLMPRPTDFSSGVFKLRSTPAGSVPLDSDLKRTVQGGVHGTGMRSFGYDLSEKEIADIVQYLKTFSPRFAAQGAALPVEIPPEPGNSTELILRGRQVYERENCAACHGAFGRGDGPASASLTDDRGACIRPHDFTLSGGVKAGNRPRDLFRSITTGLDGTPMHDYMRLAADERWALVYYLMCLSEQPAPDLGPDSPLRRIGQLSR